jgi:hypothetical protein
MLGMDIGVFAFEELSGGKNCERPAFGQHDTFFSTDRQEFLETSDVVVDVELGDVVCPLNAWSRKAGSLRSILKHHRHNLYQVSVMIEQTYNSTNLGIMALQAIDQSYIPSLLRQPMYHPLVLVD